MTVNYPPPKPSGWLRCHFCKGRGYYVVGTVFGRGMHREMCSACRGYGIVGPDEMPFQEQAAARSRGVDAEATDGE
jgi:hypothetical protein